MKRVLSPGSENMEPENPVNVEKRPEPLRLFVHVERAAFSGGANIITAAARLCYSDTFKELADKYADVAFMTDRAHQIPIILQSFNVALRKQ